MVHRPGSIGIRLYAAEAHGHPDRLLVLDYLDSLGFTRIHYGITSDPLGFTREFTRELLGTTGISFQASYV